MTRALSHPVALRTAHFPDPDLANHRRVAVLLDSLAVAMDAFGLARPRHHELGLAVQRVRLDRADYALTDDHAMSEGLGYDAPADMLDHIDHTAETLGVPFACVANAALMLRAQEAMRDRRKPRGDRGDFTLRLRLFIRPERAGMPSGPRAAPRRGRPPAHLSSTPLLNAAIERLSRAPTAAVRDAAKNLDLDPVSCLADAASALPTHRPVETSYLHAAALVDLAHVIDPANPPDPVWLASRLLERALSNAAAKLAKEARASPAPLPARSARDLEPDTPAPRADALMEGL